MPVTASGAFVYPRLWALHVAEEGLELGAEAAAVLPATLPLSYEKLEPDGVYLLEDAGHLFLWVGRGASQERCHELLQLPGLDGVDCSRVSVPQLPTPISQRANAYIGAVNAQRPHVLQMPRVLAPKDPMEARFLGMMVEDRAQTSMSYVEYLCHVHRQIQAKFN